MERQGRMEKGNKTLAQKDMKHRYSVQKNYYLILFLLLLSTLLVSSSWTCGRYLVPFEIKDSSCERDVDGNRTSSRRNSKCAYQDR